jgi:phage recombination protein Bet
MSASEPAAATPGEVTGRATATGVAVVKVDEATTIPAIRDWSDDYRRLVRRTVLKPKEREATEVELAFFAEQVKRTGLDPFHKQVYAIYRKKKGVEELTIQVGIDGFRLIAERTGKYEGQTAQQWCGPDGVWHEVWTQDGHPFAARIGVHKRGRREPTYAVAHWAEYVQTFNGTPTGKWMPTAKGGMPANQLSKCAEALALRKCFPAELSGFYTPEEMEQADNSPALDAGQGDGQPQGFLLGDDIEAVLARAATLGVALDRGMVEMDVCDRDGHVIPDRAAKWIATHTAVLDAIPQDAEVVDAQEAPVSAAAPQAPERPSEAAAASEAPAVDAEAADLDTATGRAADAMAESFDEAAAEDRIAALRRRATELLNAAQAAEEAGRGEEADSHYSELAAVEANLDAMTNDDQGTLI